METARSFDTINPKKQQQIAHYLTGDEQMLFFATVSPFFLLNNFIKHLVISSLLVMGAGLGSWLFLPTQFWPVIAWGTCGAFGYALMRYYFTKEGIQYILTNKRLIVQKGYFHVSMSSTNYSKITHIEVHQGWIDRVFFHYGEVIVKTAAEQRMIILEVVHQPVAFKNLLEKLISQEKESFGRTSI